MNIFDVDFQFLFGMQIADACDADFQLLFAMQIADVNFQFFIFFSKLKNP